MDSLYAEYIKDYGREKRKRKTPLSKLALNSWYQSRRHSYESLGYDTAKFDDQLDSLDLGSIGDSFTELDSQIQLPGEVKNYEKERSDLAEHRQIERQYKEYAKAEGIAA